MLETYADRPSTTQLTVKRDFVHSEIGASADLRMDKVELIGRNNHEQTICPETDCAGAYFRIGAWGGSSNANAKRVCGGPKPGRDLGRSAGRRSDEVAPGAQSDESG